MQHWPQKLITSFFLLTSLLILPYEKITFILAQIYQMKHLIIKKFPEQQDFENASVI